jgi:hypothetical protein
MKVYIVKGQSGRIAGVFRSKRQAEEIMKAENSENDLSGLEYRWIVALYTLDRWVTESPDQQQARLDGLEAKRDEV